MPRMPARSLLLLVFGALGGFGLTLTVNDLLVRGLLATGRVNPEVMLAGGRLPVVGVEPAPTAAFAAGLAGGLLAVRWSARGPARTALLLLGLAVCGPALVLAAALPPGRPETSAAHLVAFATWGVGAGVLVAGSLSLLRRLPGATAGRG